MQPIDLLETAARLPKAWTSRVLGTGGGANIKVLRMDGRPYAEEVHDIDEALLVVWGAMHLQISGHVSSVAAGELVIVPAGQPHAVAPGSHGVLIVVDR